MKKNFTMLVFSCFLVLNMNAQTLDPSIDWASVEKISLGGQELVVSSGNDGRNIIQYWNRDATLVIDDVLFFKAAPPTDPEVDKIDTTYTDVNGSTLGILASELEDYTDHCGEDAILKNRPHPNGNTDSLEIYCQKMFIDTSWTYSYIHQLWSTKGTNETTERVPGTENLEEPKHLIGAKGDLVFTAVDRTDGIRYIYRYDGTTTKKVSEFPNPYGLSQFGDEILFGVQTGDGENANYATCVTDADNALGSRIISTDIGPCPNSAISQTTQQWSQYAPFQVIHKRDDSGIKAVFFGGDRSKGVEICVTDGQTAEVILDIEDTPDTESDDPNATLSTERGEIIIAVNKYQAAFRVVTPGKWGRDPEAVSFQQNMWITDGTPSGTWLFEDQNRNSDDVGGQPATGNSFAGDPFLFDGNLYYTGQTNNDRQIIVMKSTYPNHVENGTSREEWVLNGPDDADSYGNSRTGYFGTYGDYMAFSARVDHFTSDPEDPKGSILNRPLEHALVLGDSYENLWVGDDAADHNVEGNGNNAMIQHITQYKDKLYYNRFNQNGERNLRVYIKADMAEGWEQDTSFWMGSFNEGGTVKSDRGPHNLRVMNGSLFFIYKEELYKLTDNQSDVETPLYDYRDPKHYVAEGVRDWESCIFDYGYGGEDTMADDCPCEYVESGSDVNDLGSSKISFYPNPATDYVYVQHDNLNIQTIIVYDINGRKILDQHYKSNKIDVSELKPGNYVIGVLTNEQKFIYSRFIKQK